MGKHPHPDSRAPTPLSLLGGFLLGAMFWLIVFIVRGRPDGWEAFASAGIWGLLFLPVAWVPVQIALEAFTDDPR